MAAVVFQGKCLKKEKKCCKRKQTSTRQTEFVEPQIVKTISTFRFLTFSAATCKILHKMTLRTWSREISRPQRHFPLVEIWLY